jgi:hypothetical protein
MHSFASAVAAIIMSKALRGRPALLPFRQQAGPEERRPLIKRQYTTGEGLERALRSCKPELQLAAPVPLRRLQDTAP